MAPKSASKTPTQPSRLTKKLRCVLFSDIFTFWMLMRAQLACKGSPEGVIQVCISDWFC